MVDAFTAGSVFSLFTRDDNRGKAITALAITDDKKNFLTGTVDGTIVSWNFATGEASIVSPDLHTAPIVRLAVANGKLFSVAHDALVKVTPVGDSGNKLHVDGITPWLKRRLPIDTLDLAVSADGKFAVVACPEHFGVYSLRVDGPNTWDNISKFGARCKPTSVALAPSHDEFIFGTQDSKLYVYHLLQLDAWNTCYKIHDVIQLTVQPTALAYSLDGKHLAVATSTGKVVLMKIGDQRKWHFEREWEIHYRRVNCVSWSPDGRRFATGSSDEDIIVWDLQKVTERPVIIRAAHNLTAVNGIVWLDSETLVTAGGDGNVRKWIVPLKN